MGHRCCLVCAAAHAPPLPHAHQQWAALEAALAKWAAWAPLTTRVGLAASQLSPPHGHHASLGPPQVCGVGGVQGGFKNPNEHSNKIALDEPTGQIESTAQSL